MAQSHLPFPQKLDLDGNIATNWRKFKRTWTNYEIASGLSKKEKELRTATFLTCIGPDAVDIYEGLAFDEENDEKDIAKVLDKFEAFCIGRTNETYERYVFNTCSQSEDMNIDAYLAKLRKLAKSCNYGVLEESLIRDRIVCGIRDNTVRKRLLQEEKLTLTKAIDTCRAFESTAMKIKSMSGITGTQGASDIHKVSTLRERKDIPKLKCKYCGKSCKPGKCPAFGKKCNKCHKYNHFASECMKGRQPQNQSQRPLQRRPRGSKFDRKVHRINLDTDNSSAIFSDDSTSDLNVVNDCVNKIQDKIFAKMNIKNQPYMIKFQLDTGATTNLIPKRYVSDDLIQHRNKKLTLYDNSSLSTIGTCKLELVNPKNNKQYDVDFVVVNDKYNPLLGAFQVQQMGLIEIQFDNILSVNASNEPTLDDVMSQYSDIFQAEGKFSEKLHLEIDKSVEPVKMPLRRVPVAMKTKLKNELVRLEDLQVIAPVDKPTDWVSSLVVVQKSSGKLRVCIDPKPLNKALKRNHFPLPVLEDLLPELGQAKVFTKLDVKNGFWHVVLDEESSYLTTFETPFGRFRWLRMPFGISPASEYFQSYLERELGDLPGVRMVADDILVFGEGKTFKDAVEDHDRKLRLLFLRCRERNIKLNKSKFEFKLTETSYIGHMLTAEGIKPDPSKVDAITKMERQSNVAAVQRLLGMVNYLAKFVDNLSEICEPLRQLTRKEAVWNWSHEQENAFENIKSKVSSAALLKYFDSTAETVLQCDSSESGLGAVIMQNGSPVTYASRALTPTEQNYAQIEKELLAVVFGMEKFNKYTYGRRIVVESDHKPLEVIYKKPLFRAPKRLQRMLLRLQRYEYEIHYKPGKQMYIADTLSRAYLRSSSGDMQSSGKQDEVLCSRIEAEVAQINMVDYLTVSRSRLDEIVKATANDVTLQKLITVISNGWEESYTPTEVMPYHSVRDELSVQNGIVFCGERCVIPKEMRRGVLEQLHTHIGTEGCLKRARESLYWPSMSAQIKDFIGKCEVCRTFETSQQKETFMPSETPTLPWNKVATDIFTYNDNEYLVTVDYFSNFFEIDKLEDTQSKTVIHKLKHYFARHGIPNMLVSDNGPQFTSDRFKRFSKDWDFEHRTSSPRYAQSNGKAESAVKTAKRLLRKCKRDDTDIYLALLNLRDTPLQSTNHSPGKQLLNRQTRTLIPVKTSLLKPQVPHDVVEGLQRNKSRQSYYYNRSARDLDTLPKGSTVRIKPENSNEWEKGVVVDRKSVRSYDVLKENGNIIRRNRRHLRRSLEQFEARPEHVIEPALESSNDKSPQSTTESKRVTPADKHISQSQVNTRSGRKVKFPNKLKDYVT